MVQKNCLDKIIIVCGPTASGKTELSVALAKKLDTEIISADSMNIYSGLNVGSAKPSKIEMQGVKHHLIDVVTPFDTFSVGDYKEIAEPIVKDLIKRGKIPIICGGTGFYINSILYDLSYGGKDANLKVREKYNKLAQEKGNEYVYNILMEQDPDSAKKLHYNDLKRVIRALEICANGTPKSKLNDSMSLKYDYKAYSIDFPTELLYKRINERVDKMIENGLIEEVKHLIDKGVNKDNQCMQGIGYKEIYSYLSGEISLPEAVEQIKLNTRHYAKRQKTFFRRFEGLNYLEPQEVDLLVNKIIGEL